MSEKELTIITVNYHSGHLIERMEQSVSGLDWVKLLVVDNSGEYESSSKNVDIIKPGRNIGFGRACNIGAKHSKTRKILFLNPDASIEADALYRLANACSDKERAIWGPTIIDESNRFKTLELTGRRLPEYRRTHINLAGLQQEK